MCRSCVDWIKNCWEMSITMTYRKWLIDSVCISFLRPLYIQIFISDFIMLSLHLRRMPSWGGFKKAALCQNSVSLIRIRVVRSKDGGDRSLVRDCQDAWQAQSGESASEPFFFRLGTDTGGTEKYTGMKVMMNERSATGELLTGWAVWMHGDNGH